MSNIGKACTMPTQNLGQQHGDRCGNFDKCSEVGESNSEHLVAECLTAGAVFTKWEEEPLSMQDCTVQVDSTGFFFCYTSDVEKETVCIDLAHVSDVRPCIPKEKIRDMLESVRQEALSDRSFALVFGSNMVEVNFLRLVSPSVKLAKDWINALQVLIRGKRFQNPSVALLLEKQYVKSKCMRNSNGKIPIKSICKCLTTHRYEQRFYDGMQTLQLPHEKNDEIDPDEFTLLHFYKLYTFLCPRQDLDELFSKKCGGRAPFMKLQQVVDFINGEQRDPRLNEILFPFCSPVKASKLIETYEPSPELSQTNRMSFDGLARYLMSEDNLILKKDHLSNKHDLSHPLSHYFIHSSHNTYLIGRQFGGKSSVEMYRQCLLAGCRCIELDCWDGLGDEPIITHGKALCTNILFKDVIVAIKESAFVSSPLPVILSFENHCSRLQQRKLAEYCIEIFGDMLLLLPLDSHPLEEGVQIPPPNQLLYKILIKNKKLNPEVENDLLISESLDCLSEKQLQAMVDSASEMNDNPDPQATVDSSHLGLRPALIQKRLSVITEGRVTADSNKADTPTLGSPEVEVGMDVATKEESIAVPTLKEMIDDSLDAAVIIRSNGVHASDADACLGADDVTDRPPLSPTDERMVERRLASLDPLQEWLATVEVIHALEEEARNGDTTNAATGDVFDSAPDTVIATKSADSLDSITVDNARKISGSSKDSDKDTDNRDSSDVKVFNKNQQAKSPSNSDKTFNSSDDFNNSCREERNKPKKLTINLLDNVDWISTDGKPIDLEAGNNAKSPEGFNGELNSYSRPVFQRSAEIRPPYNDIKDSTDPNNEYKDCSKRAANSQSINSSMSSLSEENLSHHNQTLISSRVLVSPSLSVLNNNTSHRSISICNIDLTSRSPNTGPKSPNTGPKSPKNGPESPNTGPKSPSTGPNSPNIGPKIPNTEPKSPTTGPKSPRTGPKSPDGSCFSPDADYEIAVSQGRTRTESVQSDISESSIEDITKPLSMTVYENSIRKNRKTPTSLSGGSISARKFADSLRRNKSPISKQMSFNEKLFKFPMQGKSFSIESQDFKRQRMPTNGSTDDCNDSDDDFRRVNHPRSASSTSSCSLGSISKPYKKNSRGISFTSEDEEMASQQFYSHKNIDPLLSSLVNYVQPTVFQSFEHAEEQNLSYKMSSFNESSAIHFVKNGPVEFNKYNKRQFSRIYPKGTRVDSTNYNPQAFWNVGCQMVTLNLQTTDLPFQLNQAKFEANSQLGYLLKPEIMRRSAEKAFDSFTESPLDGIIPATVVIKVISGQFLTDKKSQTYVMVELYGLPADTKRKNKTKLVSSNYMNTLFNDESFEFSKVILPELVLVRFAVYDESDRVLGQVVLPLEGIQPGYRHIPLKTESGHQCQLSTLFVHISLKTYVPEKFADFADRLFEPMKYETQVEKRSKQMKKFDISEIEEDTDIPAHSNPQDGSTSPLIERKISSDESGLDSIIKVEEYVKKKERVTFEDFQHDKQYLKLLKKHQKDLDVLEKKHEKERANMQKVKQTGREKIKASFEKNKMSEEKMLEKLSKRSGSDISNDILTNFEQKIKYLEKHMHEKLVESASKRNQEEAEMTAKHIHERVGMRLYQVAEQLEYLKSLLHQSQQQEEKLLREKFDRQMTELKKKQAKQSIDAARSISAVKAIKSKEEKERLQREQDRQNMGIFISGRQELMKKQDKEMEDLRQRHREDIERMEKEHNKIMENEKNIFRKVTVAKQQILHS